MDKETERLKAFRFALVIGCLLGQAALVSCVPAAASQTSPGATTTSVSGTTSTQTATATVLPRTTPASTPRPAEYASLVQHVLDLINKDRADNGGLPPVTLGANQAAQWHADDMFAGFFLSHWGTDGLKPYMRYTLAGGVNYEGENSAYAGWTDPADDPNRWATIDARTELQHLEYLMVYEDDSSNWGHRDNILNPLHKRVNIGIAWDSHRLAFVEQFEGDYVQFSQLPALSGSMLSMSGTAVLGVIYSVGIYYDPAPRPWTNRDLVTGPHSYGLGDMVELVHAPPPPGYSYTNLPPNAVQASEWTISSDSFTIRAELSLALKSGPGVYTVAITSKVGTGLVQLTNYSLFVK